MAIDPKELRIGSHVNANGVRAKVIDIHNKTLSPDCKYQIFVEGISPEDGEKKVVGSYADGLDPILITPELLTELGFEKHEVHGKESYHKMSYALRYKPNTEVWTFEARRTLSDCKYLHELETMAYHATKQELIND